LENRRLLTNIHLHSVETTQCTPFSRPFTRP